MLKKIFKTAVVFIITAEAKFILKKYKPRIIAVTGSVGKTSTKDAVFSVLSSKGFVRKSEKSFNSEIGVPLTILGRPNAWSNPFAWISTIFAGLLLIIKPGKYPEWLVLEVGADRPGDIKRIASWLLPDVVVVTRLAPVPVHVEYFSSPGAVFKEKGELVKALKKDGTLVLSADDENVLVLEKLASGRKLVTFGFSRKASVMGSKVAIAYEGRGISRHPIGVHFSVRMNDERAEIGVRGSVGRQMAYAALAALATGISVGLSMSDAVKGLLRYEGPLGRMRLVEGIKHTLIIDDTYNSSPVAVQEALDALASLSTKGRKIAVLGDMLELGRFSVEEHHAIGTYAFTRADMLVTVGIRSRDTARGAIEAGFAGENILQFDDSRKAGKALEGLIKEGDVILIKGSQGIRMERAVEEIMAHPEDRERLLVRQEEEWMKR